MSENSDIRDLLRLAITEERLGGVFYASLAERFAEQDLGGMFDELARQEHAHQQRFARMLEDLGGPSTSPPRGGLLADEADARARADTAPSAVEAIDLANRLEREALMVLHELSGGVSQAHSPLLAEIVAEEQEHLKALAEARSRL